MSKVKGLRVMEEGKYRDSHDSTDSPKTIGSMVGAQDRADLANPVSNRLNQVNRREVIGVSLIIECGAKFNILFNIGILLPAPSRTGHCCEPGDQANNTTCTRKAKSLRFRIAVLEEHQQLQ